MRCWKSTAGKVHAVDVEVTDRIDQGKGRHQSIVVSCEEAMRIVDNAGVNNNVDHVREYGDAVEDYHQDRCDNAFLFELQVSFPSSFKFQLVSLGSSKPFGDHHDIH